MIRKVPPRTYFEWVQCFEAIDHNEEIETVMPLLQEGELEWTSGVAERFTTRLCDLIDRKLKHTADQVQISFERASGNELAIAHALLDAKKAYRQAYSLASLSVLPEPTKASVQDLVLQSARTMQASLEESARRDRTGHMARLVHDIPLTLEDMIDLQIGKHPEGIRPGRKVIYHE